jgi:hypothetical protein
MGEVDNRSRRDYLVTIFLRIAVCSFVNLMQGYEKGEGRGNECEGGKHVALSGYIDRTNRVKKIS